MKRLSKVVNIVPVIAKADTLTLEERVYFKQRVGCTASTQPSLPRGLPGHIIGLTGDYPALGIHDGDTLQPFTACIQPLGGTPSLCGCLGPPFPAASGFGVD